jgi:hypothetical protein
MAITKWSIAGSRREGATVLPSTSARSTKGHLPDAAERGEAVEG